MTIFEKPFFCQQNLTPTKLPNSTTKKKMKINNLKYTYSKDTLTEWKENLPVVS